MRALEHLMGTYFHQDWDLDGGEVSDTVEAFATGAPRQVAPAAREIDELMALPLPPGHLVARLEQMGCDYHAGATDDDYREWLIQLRDLLQKHLDQPGR